MCAAEQGRGKEARALAGRPTLERINDVGEGASLRDNRWNYVVARAGAVPFKRSGPRLLPWDKRSRRSCADGSSPNWLT